MQNVFLHLLFWSMAIQWLINFRAQILQFDYGFQAVDNQPLNSTR